ncbi:caspase family protein [Candidatus Brocadia pituitae]|nr:caspase family protein [Candidatus Brocadia pituitae]
MPKGIALTTGLNAVNPAHYGGWSGELNACEADAKDMAEIAQSKGFDVKTLLTKEATRKNVIDGITKAASALTSGDIFMLSYSGHGGQLPDLNSDEDDAQDETWCLYDGELVDDEIYALLGKFVHGVRILVFSDSCHSGTVTKLVYYQSAMRATGPKGISSEIRYRFMPMEVAVRTYRDNKKFYDPILKDPKLKESRDAVKASAILISGCQDNQLSADGTFNGLFTANLLQVWNEGKFKKGYRAFRRAIVNRMPPDQTPNYFRVGEINRAFEKQKPFTI